MAVPVLIFEDPAVADLEPITLGRPAFTISCGGCSLIQQLRALGGRLAAVVRPHLAASLTADDGPLSDLDGWHAAARTSQEPVLLVGARLVPSAANRTELAELIDQRQPGIVREGGTVVAALVPAARLPQLSELTVELLPRWLADSELTALTNPLVALRYPHEIVQHHLSTFRDNLVDCVWRLGHHEVAPGVYSTKGVELGPHVAVDTTAGPIVLSDDVQIGPFTYLEGPLLVGEHVRIRAHASIQQFTSLGRHCKIGGEVESSIMEPYSNKQHYGYLGHSYVGRWVNLGAGTCTSNLKNTYGTVRIEHGRKKIETGMQMLGAMIGDFAKTAVNVSIYTGKTIGTASFVYGTAAENVPSFVNYARSFGQVTEVSPEVAATMQQRMFARRGIGQRPCDAALLNAMHAMTAAERAEITAPAGPPRF